MQRQSSGDRRTMPVTEAVYKGRQRKSKTAKKASKRTPDSKHGFGLASQLPPETLRELGWNPLTGRLRGSTGTRRHAGRARKETK